MPDLKKATVKQLAHQIKGYGTKPSARFAFFLGAGASVQSGIPAAGWMIRDFKQRIVARECPDQCKSDSEKDAWITSQSWFNADKQYSTLFEHLESKEIGRQRYIEQLIENRKPSFGYVMLANLLASGYTNTIITTNFDDLVYSACTTFTDIRPIVFAYGILASEMRITTPRPKILKLHGDFLYSKLKNTDAELTAQDPNMADQTGRVLGEHDLVVIGYSGGDESVMKILREKLPENNDLYWCVRRGDEPANCVKELLNIKGGFLVEIDGLDEMMNETREIIGFDVRAMLGSIQKHQSEMIEQLKSFAPQKELANILAEIAIALEKQAEQQETLTEEKRALQFFAEGLEAQNLGKSKEAEVAYEEAIRLNPKDVSAYNNLGIILMTSGRTVAAEASYRKAIEINPSFAKAYVNMGRLLYRYSSRLAEAEGAFRNALTFDPSLESAFAGLSMVLRLQNRDEEALASLERQIQLEQSNYFPFLALASVHKKLGHADESAKFAVQARALMKPDDWYNLACLESVCGNVDAAIEHLRRAAQSEKFDPDWAKRDPDLEWIRADPRFKGIVGGS